MTQSGEIDSDRLLVEVQVSDAAGRMVGDSRLVMKFADGIGRVVETLRMFDHRELPLRLDLRVSELLSAGERAELERLRKLVRIAGGKVE